jgi:hypothetical protein
MADNNICPFLAAGKIASYSTTFDLEGNKVVSQAPISVDCRKDRCHMWHREKKTCVIVAYMEK